MLSHKPDFHLSLTRFFNPGRKSKIFTRGPRSTLRELCTQIRWRKIRYSVASLLTNPVSSSTQPQGIISDTPQVMRGVRFLPHAKNQRFFPRGPRLRLRLCPTKCPRFAAVLCGDLALFPQKKNARRSPRSSFLCVAPELSRCSLIFAPRGGRLPPPVLFLRTSGCAIRICFGYDDADELPAARKENIHVRAAFAFA